MEGQYDVVDNGMAMVVRKCIMHNSTIQPPEVANTTKMNVVIHGIPYSVHYIPVGVRVIVMDGFGSCLDCGDCFISPPAFLTELNEHIHNAKTHTPAYIINDFKI